MFTRAARVSEREADSVRLSKVSPLVPMWVMWWHLANVVALVETSVSSFKVSLVHVFANRCSFATFAIFL